MKYFLFITLLLFSTTALAFEIPEKQLNKSVYIEVGGKIKYETEKPLALGFNILKQADYAREIKLSVDGNKDLFTITVKYNNGSIIKFSIDKNNILRKAYIYNAKIKRQEIYEGKKLGPEINAIMLNVGLAFTSSERIAIETAEKKEREKLAELNDKKARYISDNLLNFDVQIPLFAGLKWDDRLFEVLVKLSKVPSINVGEIECYNIYDDDLTAKLDILLEMYNKYGKSKSDEKIKLLEQIIQQSKTVSEANNINNCRIRALITLSNKPASIDLKIGRAENREMHMEGVENYLHQIGVHVTSDDNDNELFDMYKSKYKNFGISTTHHGFDIVDDFENTIEISNSKYYRETISILYNKNKKSEAKQADLQIKIIEKINQIEKEKQNKNKPKSSEPTADSAI